MPRDIIDKLLKTKDTEINLEISEKECLNCMGKVISMTVDFSSETMEARRK